MLDAESCDTRENTVYIQGLTSWLSASIKYIELNSRDRKEIQIPASVESHWCLAGQPPSVSKFCFLCWTKMMLNARDFTLGLYYETCSWVSYCMSVQKNVTII